MPGPRLPAHPCGTLRRVPAAHRRRRGRAVRSRGPHRPREPARLAERRTLTACTRGPCDSRPRSACAAPPRLPRSDRRPRSQPISTPPRSRPSSPGPADLPRRSTSPACVVSVQRLTTVDTMTGLRNREFLFERLSAEIARAKRYSSRSRSILIDFDDFGAFNGRHGNLRRQPPAAHGRQPRQDERPRGHRRRLPLRRRRVRAPAAQHARLREGRGSRRRAHPQDDRDHAVPRRERPQAEPRDREPGHRRATRCTPRTRTSSLELAAEACRAAKAAGKNRVGLYNSPR